MILLLVFLLAAALTGLSSRLPLRRERRLGGPRFEGIVFVGAVLLSAVFGLLLNIDGLRLPRLNNFTPASLATSGFALLLLTGALYAACALQGKWRLPAWLADVFLVAVTATAVYALHQPMISVPRLPFTERYIALGAWAGPLTILFVWAVSRMTAALNRTPQVTGGYLGVVAFALLLLSHFKPNTDSTFPGVASAALAGAGLASVPMALRAAARGEGGFNMGWPAALAMGFLVSQIAVVGLFKNLTLAILGCWRWSSGLPLLDVSHSTDCARRSAAKKSWEERHLRLHQALLRRGISRGKVSLLYLAIACYLCGVGVLLIVSGSLNVLLRLVVLAALLFAGFVVFFSLTRVLMRRTEGEEIPEDIEAFGVRISPVSMTQAMDKIESFIAARTPITS